MGVTRKWDITVQVEAKKYLVDGRGAETETALGERIEVGLFTAEPAATPSTRST